MSYEDKQAEAERIGLEVVPILFEGKVDSPEHLLSFLKRTSILGGQKIEGVVVKNYHRFGQDKKVLMGKYVSEAFKEVHSASWKESNPSVKDVIQTLIMSLKTPARWNKAIQHLRENGTLTDSPRDIGELIKEVHHDIKKECEDEIKDKLYRYALPSIMRGVVSGLPEWYKEELMKRQFTDSDNLLTPDNGSNL
jgi:protein required for attachment to host cells